jgi:hypothetical protein
MRYQDSQVIPQIPFWTQRRPPNSAFRVAGVFKAETNIKVRMAPDVNAPSLAGADSAKLKSGGGVLGGSSHLVSGL